MNNNDSKDSEEENKRKEEERRAKIARKHCNFIDKFTKYKFNNYKYSLQRIRRSKTPFLHFFWQINFIQ